MTTKTRLSLFLSSLAASALAVVMVANVSPATARSTGQAASQINREVQPPAANGEFKLALTEEERKARREQRQKERQQKQQQRQNTQQQKKQQRQQQKQQRQNTQQQKQQQRQKTKEQRQEQRQKAKEQRQKEQQQRQQQRQKTKEQRQEQRQKAKEQRQENRQDAKEKRQEKRQDAKEERQEKRQDAKEERQEKRQDAKDKRQGRNANNEQRSRNRKERLEKNRREHRARRKNRDRKVIRLGDHKVIIDKTDRGTIRKRAFRNRQGDVHYARSRRHRIHDRRHRNRFRGGTSVYFLPPTGVDLSVDAYVVDSSRASADLYVDTFLAPPVRDIDRRYTVEEVVDDPEVRSLVRSVNLDNLTFESGSSDIQPDELNKLDGLADAIQTALDEDPSQKILIEGHTDAVGSDESNLVLSEERAATVQLAFIEEYGIPAENLEAVGYGEQYLRIETQGDERRNRRVTIRAIGKLLADAN